MKNSKLIKLLKLFDPSETKQLKKFVQKMNSDEALPKLFKFLLKQAPQFDYRKEQCYKAVYANKVFSDSTLRKLFAKGIQITEQFIVWNRLQQSELTKSRFLAEFYKEKEATALWEKQMASWEKVNQKTEWDQQLKENLTIAEHRYQYHGKIKDKIVDYKHKIAQIDAFAEILNQLEKFIIRQVLGLKIRSKTIFNLETRKREFNFIVLEEIVNLILNLDESTRKKYWDSHNAIVSVWKTYILLDTKDHSQYLDLKQLTQENNEDIPKTNQIQILNNLLHYCYVYHEKQGVKLPHDAFKIYKLLLDRKLCYRDGYLVPAAYYSLCNIAYTLRETDWLKWFIDNHTKELPTDEQFHYYHYFHGLFCLLIKDFKKAIHDFEVLEKANSYMYNFDAKYRLLMLYYEVESDRFPDAVNAFRVMLSRDNKSPKKRVNDYKLFVNYIYQVYNSPNGSKEKLSKLKQKIVATDFSVPKTWLLEKVEEKLSK